MSDVLLVEDAPELAMLTSALLETLDDLTVRVAADGPTALRAAQDPVPDLVLLDVGLPGMDGPEVLRRLRADARTADVAVVFLTGAGHLDEEHLVQLGARAVLRKPFTPAALLDGVAIALGRSQR